MDLDKLYGLFLKSFGTGGSADEVARAGVHFYTRVVPKLVAVTEREAYVHVAGYHTWCLTLRARRIAERKAVREAIKLADQLADAAYAAQCLAYLQEVTRGIDCYEPHPSGAANWPRMSRVALALLRGEKTADVCLREGIKPSLAWQNKHRAIERCFAQKRISKEARDWALAHLSAP